MTSAAWQAHSRAAPYVEARPTVIDALAFACAVLILLIYSQGWLAPLTDYGEGASQGALIRSLYFPAYLAGLVVLSGALWRTIEGGFRAPLLILLMLVVAASWTWSNDPAATMRRFVALTFTVLGGVAIAARFRWPTFAEACAAAFAILAVVSTVLVLVKPHWGLMTQEFPGAWRGLWLEKNNLGGNMVFGSVFCAAAAILVPRRRMLWIGFFLLCVALIGLSTSKTSLVTLTMSLACLAFIWLVRRGPAAGVAFSWIAVFGIALVVGLGFALADTVLDLLGKDATLTGRTEIWEGIGRIMQGHQWTGFGYGAVWENEAPFTPLPWIVHYAGFRPNHAHNGWMEIWISLGWVGIIVFGLWFAETWIRAIGTTLSGGDGAWVALPMLAAYSLGMLTESITLTWHDLRWVLFVAVAVKLVYPPETPPVRWARAS